MGVPLTWQEWHAVAESRGQTIDRLAQENVKLRELVRGLMYCADEAHGMCARTPIGGGRPFTCRPIYDYDSREYGCEKLKCELGIEVE